MIHCKREKHFFIITHINVNSSTEDYERFKVTGVKISPESIYCTFITPSTNHTMFGKHINVITKASRGCLQEL
jgi:hypothetical protein